MSSQDVATTEAVRPPAPARVVPPPGSDHPPVRARPLPASHGLAFVTLVGGIAAALAAQKLVVDGAQGAVALLAFAIAAGIFVVGLVLGADAGPLIWRGPLAERTPAIARPRQRGLDLRPRLACGAIALGVVTFLASGGNHFTIFNVTTWVLSVALALAATWQGDLADLRSRAAGGWRRRRGTMRDGPTLRLSWTAFALAIILVCGVAILLYRIDQVPAEMTSDHAEKLLDVQDVLDGQHRIFFPRNTGREALQFYLIAIMTPLTGLSYLTMKLGTALVAAVTLPFTFLLARLLFGNRFALLTTAILATTRWLWQVGRVGLRFPFPPAFGSAIFYFLLKAIRDRRRNDFLLCGLVLGLSQHSYTALRLAPLAVLAIAGIALVVDVWRREPPGRVHRLVFDTTLLGVIAVLAAMPLLRYGFDQPESFLFRSVTRIASDTQSAVPAQPLVIFLGNIKKAFLMFNWRGDVVWVNTIPGIPILDPVSGALFFLGCVYGLYRIVRYRELPYLYLFVLLFIGLLPSMLSLAYPGENPSTVRSGMAIPITVAIVALPVMLLARGLAGWIREWTGPSPLGGPVAAGLVVWAFLVPMVQINTKQYFDVYARQHTASSQHTTAVARVVNGFLAMGGRREDVYIFPGAYWFDTRLVAIQAGDIRWQPLIRSVEEVRRADGGPRERLYIVHPEDRDTLERLALWYPTATRQAHVVEESAGQPFFVTVVVPPETRAAG